MTSVSVSESPSKVFRDWLEASGKTLVGDRFAGCRTKWHFAIEEDGWALLGFVEAKDDERLEGIIEVDKRYRPTAGFPVNARGTVKTDAHLHCVMNKNKTEVAVMTPWSFGPGQLDDEQPDRFDEDLGAMLYRVKPESYKVHDLMTAMNGNLIQMVEEDDER